MFFIKHLTGIFYIQTVDLECKGKICLLPEFPLLCKGNCTFAPLNSKLFIRPFFVKTFLLYYECICETELKYTIDDSFIRRK